MANFHSTISEQQTDYGKATARSNQSEPRRAEESLTRCNEQRRKSHSFLSILRSNVEEYLFDSTECHENIIDPNG